VPDSFCKFLGGIGSFLGIAAMARLSDEDAGPVNWKAVSIVAGAVLLLSFGIIGALLLEDRKAVVIEAKQETLDRVDQKLEKIWSGQSDLKLNVNTVINNQNKVMATVDKLSDMVPRLDQKVQDLDKELKHHEEMTKGRGKTSSLHEAVDPFADKK